MEPSAPLLGYASPETSSGVSCQQDAYGARVSVARMANWRQLPSGFWLVGCFIGFAWLNLAAEVLSQRSRAPELAVPFAMYSVLLVGLMFSAYLLMTSRTVLEINRQDFRLTRYWLGRPRVAVWDRGQVREFKVNVYTGRLALHIAGADPIELSVSPDAQVTARIAAFLQHALMSGEFAATPEAPLGSTPLPSRSPARLAIAIAGGVLLVAGVSILFFPALACTGMGIIAASLVIIPGVMLGTQEKDFYC